MAALYAQLIIHKRRTFEQVPDKDKAAVEIKLREQGYNTNGQRIVEVM